MNGLSQSNRDRLIDEVRNELEMLSRSRYRQVTRCEDSFVGWLRNQIYEIARAIGLVISLPFRALWDSIRGFFDGLFR